MRDCPGKLMGSWKNSSFLIISNWWQPVPCKAAAYFSLMQKRTLRCFESSFCLLERCICGVITTVLPPSDWIFSLQQSAFSIQQPLSLFMANQSWSLATGASALCERFLSSKENHLFPPSYPLGKLWLCAGNCSSVSMHWSRNLPRTSLAPELARDLQSHMSQLLHSFLGLWF